MSWKWLIGITRALEQEYNLIISIDCYISWCEHAASVSGSNIPRWMMMIMMKYEFITCASFTAPLIIAIIMENYASSLCRFDYFYRVATESLVKDYPRIWNHNRAYELQLNQIIRHHDEWIISPGYLLYASFIVVCLQYQWKNSSDLPDAPHCVGRNVVIDGQHEK